jgi:fructose-bisphosphate aldolase class II
VHIDVSQADHHATEETIVATTRQVVAHALTTGALVEGQLRYLPGSSTVHRLPPDAEAIAGALSSPDTAGAFVEATGINTFAVGIGNLHGLYSQPKALDLDLLARIRRRGRHLPQPARRQRHPRLRLRRRSSRWHQQDQRQLGASLHLPNGPRARARRPSPRVRHRQAGRPRVIDAVQAVVEAKIVAFGSAGHSRL